jgi:hypothetical protein
MRNLYDRYPPNIGYIERKDQVIVPTVITAQKEGQLIPYETLKLMVEDGWVVD